MASKVTRTRAVEGANRIYRGGSHRSMPTFIESLDPARKRIVSAE